MAEYLENPRRVPRETIRCKARLALPSGSVDTTTEDIGSRGCQVVLPAAPRRGEAVTISLSAPRYPAALRVDGRVVWVSPQSPWRVGVAYDASSLPGAAQWMEGLRKAAPELFTMTRRTPDRLSVDAMIFLGAVPRLADFTDDEMTVLRTIGAGSRLGDLRKALSEAWPMMARAFFSLLGQGHVLLSRGASTHPAAWKEILGEPLKRPLEIIARASGRLMDDGPTKEQTSPGSEMKSTPTPVSRRVAQDTFSPIETTPAPPKPPPTPPPAPPAKPPPIPAEQAAAAARPTPDYTGAGVGWRAPAQPRSPQAESAFQLGLAEMGKGKTAQALALLRHSLALAPGDAEIANAIGRAMQGSGGGSKPSS
jgi:hypothetical protein